jgi:hypothetical protein
MNFLFNSSFDIGVPFSFIISFLSHVLHPLCGGLLTLR